MAARTRAGPVGLLLLFVLAAGCSSGPRTYPVSGTVTLDGEPLPEGDIVFVAEGGALGPDAGKIKDGKFAFRAKAGKKKVEVRASRIIPGGARGAGGEPVPEEYIPERYNAQTTLAAEVTADGGNEFEYKLEGKKK